MTAITLSAHAKVNLELRITAARPDDASLGATLRVEVTPPEGGGAVRWTRQLGTDFGGQPGDWAYAESPLLDGDLLIAQFAGRHGPDRK